MRAVLALILLTDYATKKEYSINAPDGNTISATEHSMAMILKMARNIPEAHRSLQKKETGIEKLRGLYQKTLGVIGAAELVLVLQKSTKLGMNILAFKSLFIKR